MGTLLLLVPVTSMDSKCLRIKSKSKSNNSEIETEID